MEVAENEEEEKTEVEKLNMGSDGDWWIKKRKAENYGMEKL